jgi:AraC-like DNA-binding protein
MTSVDRIIDGLRVGVEPFAVCELRGPASLDMGRHEQATLHFALAGRGRLHVGDAAPIDIDPDTVVVIPPDRRHRLETEAAQMTELVFPGCTPLDGGWRLIREGSEKRGVVMACSALSATYREGYGLFAHLDRPLVERLAPDDHMRRALDALLDELAHPQPGTRALAASLMQQCLVLILRRQLMGRSAAPAWIAALAEPHLGAALDAMLDHPAAPHTVGSLADVAGMSRSAFAERFSDQFGRTPIELLREIRLERAATLLRGSRRPIKALASDVGYESRSQFTRAFKEQFGVSPASYRLATEEPAN